MKKIILLIILLSLNISEAQQGWYLQNSNTISPLNHIYFINSHTGFAVGNLTYLKTTDGGTVWKKKDSLHSFQCIKFFNESTGIMGGYREIRRTTDCGESWAVSEYPYDEGYFNVWIVNDSSAYASCTYSRSLFKTNNKGLTWEHEVNLPSSYEPKPFFLNFETGWVVSNFSFCKTTNAGYNWMVIEGAGNMNSSTLNPILFVNAKTGWFTSGNAIRKTQNGGLTWNEQSINSGFGITSLFYLNENTGWCSWGYQSGKIFKTTNGGNSWESTNTNTLPLYSVFFINESTGWAVGEGGTIIKTTTGGLTGIQNITASLPDNYTLSQNYPNPFNPNTVVGFQLPVAGFTSLKVFDLLGREVANLVNENLSAGSYKYNFNAASLPSGVYFYKLETEIFSEVKKMALIK